MVGVYQVNNQRVRCYGSAVFSPDGRRIVTTGLSSPRVWTIYPSIEEKVAVSRERLSRGFSKEECRRFFCDDPESCPRELDQLFALFEDDLQTP